MNRREVISALGIGGVVAAAGTSRAPAEATPGLRPSPPAVTPAEAVRLAERHAADDRVETADQFMSSARLAATDGVWRWEVRWDGNDPLTKGDRFIVAVDMDRQCEVRHGLRAGRTPP